MLTIVFASTPHNPEQEIPIYGIICFLEVNKEIEFPLFLPLYFPQESADMNSCRFPLFESCLIQFRFYNVGADFINFTKNGLFHYFRYMRSDNYRSNLIQRYGAFSCCFLKRNHSSISQVARTIT